MPSGRSAALTSEFEVGGFEHVDGAADPSAYVEWMQRQRRTLRDAALGALRIGNADVVLDLGCGPGADLSTIAEHAGQAVGVDLSVAMANAAARAWAGFVAVADARRLPFGDETFDACWASLVLIHTPEPQQAVREVARVLKRSGRAVFVEPDHGSHVIATTVPDVFERVKQHRGTKFRNPFIGRSLNVLAVGAGLTVTKTWAIPVVYTSLAAARAAGGPFDGAASDACDAGAITHEEARRYLSSLEDYDRRGAFVFAGVAIATAAARAVTALLFDRPINRHRRYLGLGPLRSALFELSLHADGVVVMASPSVIDGPPDWPDNVETTSFVTWDRADRRPLSEAVEAFLADGEPPVLVTLGSSSALDAEDFFDLAVRVALDRGARVLVITGPAPPPELIHRDEVCTVDYAPFSAVMPRCRAAIHHAGVGTTVEAIKAGIPQVAVPKGFDQPDTAARIEQLGIGVAVPWRHRHRDLRRALDRALSEPSFAAHAIALGTRVSAEDGASTSADAIERHLP